MVPREGGAAHPTILVGSTEAAENNSLPDAAASDEGTIDVVFVDKEVVESDPVVQSPKKKQLEMKIPLMNYH